ncbi:MAG TPA: FtsX-like permease family protein [Verrucomicrobiae bacterium]|nr:FtsX-like permease family protein [Verrucomicrobiae bacterium]
MNFFHLIWSNFKRKKLRTLLTLFSIMIAFVLFGFLSAIKMALVGGVSLAGADRLVVRNKVSIIQLLPESYEGRMERVEGVANALHFTWFGGIYQDPKNFFAQMPTKPDELREMYPEWVFTDEAMAAWKKTRTGAVVGRATADRFKWKVGDRIPIQSTIWEKQDGSRVWEFDLVGIYEGKTKAADTSQLFFRHDYFEEARAFAKGEVGWYVIRVKDPNRAAEIAKLIDVEFENSPAETKTETEGAFIQAFAKQIGDIALLTAAISAAVFFTILLVAGNTMAQAVRERTGELGVLKALGFTNGRVMALVLIESCLMALLGGGIGLAVAWVMIASGDPTKGMLPLFFFPVKDLFVGIAIAAALGLVTGIFPALQAMRLRVADALRRM